MALLKYFPSPMDRVLPVRRPNGGAWRGLLAVLAALLTFAPPTLRAQGASKEYQVKAAFIFNLIQFVVWPPAQFASDEAPFVIGVLGEDPFAGALDAVIRGEKIRGHPLRITRSNRVADLMNSHVVFVSQSERAQMATIIAAFAGRPVLTVADLPDFAARGGVLNFYAEGARIRFEVNRATAQHAGLKLGSQLLGLARLVGPELKTEAR